MFTSFASRCACATLLAATLLAGCTDELKYRKGDPANGSIGFNARLMSGWVNTRAEQCDRPYVSDVKGGEAIADSLFLNMTTTPGVMTGTYDLRHAEGLEYDTDRKGEGIVTRATPITPDNGEMYTDFGVSAYSYQGDWNEATATPDYFYNLKASKSSDGKYTLPATYFWPGPNYKMRFFAVAPYNNPYYVVSGQEHIGSPKITVDLPTTLTNHKDLLVAATGELTGNGGKEVDLQFMHPLTAIRFVVGDDMAFGTISNISIQNVFGKGELNLGTKQWTLGTVKRSYSQALTLAVADQGDGNAAPDTEITTPVQTFMMIPQALPDNAQISMTIKVGSTTRTVTASLAGQTWLPGTTVTYQLSTTSINWTYTFTASVSKAPSTLQNGTISVTSYRTHFTGKKSPMPYTATYAKNGEGNYSPNVPEYFTIDPFVSSITAQTYNVGLLDSDLLQIRKNEPVGQSARYNLSNSTGASEIENTANCYVIQAAGKYKLPLVYGNAIKDGEPNPNSYTPTVTGDEVRSYFSNHIGIITDPYIYNNANCVPADCNLIYQTAQGAIENLKLDAEKKFIEFDVNQEFIKPGNALISVVDAEGTIMWSWHLWFTSKDTNATIPISDDSGHPKKLMSLYLGQTGYNGNSNIENNIKSVEVKISNSQTEIILPIKYTNPPTGPLFWWGRKDPIGIVQKDPTAYTTSLMNGYNMDGESIPTCAGRTPMGYGEEFFQNCIKKPNSLASNAYILDSKNMYVTYSYTNLWDNRNNTRHKASPGDMAFPIKTVYDPSPPGFTIMSESVGHSFVKYTCQYPDYFGHTCGNFWILELGFLDYTEGTYPNDYTYLYVSYGKSAYLVCNKTANLRGAVSEFGGGRHYSSKNMWGYFSRKAHCCHQVYCQKEEVNR